MQATKLEAGSRMNTGGEALEEKEDRFLLDSSDYLRRFVARSELGSHTRSGLCTVTVHNGTARSSRHQAHILVHCAVLLHSNVTWCGISCRTIHQTLQKTSD